MYIWCAVQLRGDIFQYIYPLHGSNEMVMVIAKLVHIHKASNVWHQLPATWHMINPHFHMKDIEPFGTNPRHAMDSI